MVYWSCTCSSTSSKTQTKAGTITCWNPNITSGHRIIVPMDLQDVTLYSSYRGVGCEMKFNQKQAQVLLKNQKSMSQSKETVTVKDGSTTVTWRVEFNLIAGMAVVVVTAGVVLLIAPLNVLKWFSDDFLKWISDDFLKWGLKWISDDLIKRLTEFLSSTILTLVSPMCLLGYTLASFLYGCWTQWGEAKQAFHNCWIPIELATLALFKMLTPQNLLQYTLLGIIVSLSPNIINQVASGLLKSQKL